MRSYALLVIAAFLALSSRLPAQSDARDATRTTRADSSRTTHVRQVSLEDAIRLADRSNESIEIARAAVTRANGQQMIARSQFLPQLNASGSYARTLASQFEGFSFGGGPDT